MDAYKKEWVIFQVKEICDRGKGFLLEYKFKKCPNDITECK
jgi:hypothetical protein